MAPGQAPIVSNDYETETERSFMMNPVTKHSPIYNSTSSRMGNHVKNKEYASIPLASNAEGHIHKHRSRQDHPCRTVETYHATATALLDLEHPLLELTGMQPEASETTEGYEDEGDPVRQQSFVNVFINSNGPPQIILLMVLLAVGFGSVIGVVPAVMTDRYARLNHGYSGDKDCSEFEISTKPEECLLGSADAQNAIALETLVANMLTFFTSSLFGSISDVHGRKRILILSMIVCSAKPILLVAMQLDGTISPNWYYAAGAISGVFNWIALALSSLSDVMPKTWRAASFGLLLTGLYFGFAVAPLLATFLGHFSVSLLSMVAVLLGLMVTTVFLPETLSLESSTAAKLQRQQILEEQNLTTVQRKLVWYLYRPIWELSILNRSSLFRLLSALAFFSGIVSSADQSLLVYYIEERLDFHDADIARLFLLMGTLGMFVQGFLLKFVNDCIGERQLIMLSFSIGSIQNFLYGTASNKVTVYIAISIGAFVGMAFPTISAIKANNVESSEQGRIQGALYSVSALASASGPTMMRFVYHYTKDGAFMGPGSMFIFASGVYAIAVYCGYLLPKEANSRDDATTLPSKSTVTSLPCSGKTNGVVESSSYDNIQQQEDSSTFNDINAPLLDTGTHI